MGAPNLTQKHRIIDEHINHQQLLKKKNLLQRDRKKKTRLKEF